MRTSDFHYDLPPELIAQAPAPQRDGSRLLVLHRKSRQLEHRRFTDLPEYLRAGDVLVLNDSKVIPARIWGRKVGGHASLEVLLVEENGRNDWWALLRPGKRVRAGTRLSFQPRAATAPPAQPPSLPLPPHSSVSAVVTEKNAEGQYRLRFEVEGDLNDMLEWLGEVPLPPYIERPEPPTPDDRERYQTVYARPPGSVAAPTAGLHFTPELLDHLVSRGVQVHYATLHVGLGTFAPVKVEPLEHHPMHAETFLLPAGTAAAIRAAKTERRRVIAVGTTSVRLLESAAAAENHAGGHGRWLREGTGSTSIFIYPPYRFQIVDALLTNFHLPASTLLMLVSAFADPEGTRGRETVLEAYREAIRERYRFYSYGDAMLLL